MIISFIRTALAWVVAVPATIIAFIFMAVGTILDPSRNLNNNMGRVWDKIILFTVGVKYKVEGVENIPESSVLVAPNHQGALDIPIIHLAVPNQYRWVAKKELFKIPFFGWSMFFMGCVPLDRSNAKKAMASLFDAAAKVKNGTSILIFPEGTRNAVGDELLPFKRGLFAIAIKSEVPILPVAIRGARALMPKGTLLIKSGTVTVKIGMPIETKGKDEEQLKNKLKEALEFLLK